MNEQPQPSQTTLRATSRRGARISRRAFLRNLSLVTAGGLMAACAIPPQEGRISAQPPHRAYVDVNVPTSRAVAEAREESETDAELADFLTLSALLTGVEDLDPALGRVYRQSLNDHPELSVSVAQLIERAKAGSGQLPATLEALESGGLFEEESMAAVADKLTEYWYTGVYDTGQGGQAVATFADALAWKTLTFTKAMSVCGSYRFWTEPPENHLD